MHVDMQLPSPLSTVDKRNLLGSGGVLPLEESACHGYCVSLGIGSSVVSGVAMNRNVFTQ